MIVVANESSAELRVFVTLPDGGFITVTLAQGHHTSIVVRDDGSYYAGAIMDAEWLERNRLTRELLSGRLADPAERARLSVDELKQLSDAINDLTREIQFATKGPWENGGGCSASVSVAEQEAPEATHRLIVGTVTITDNPAGGFPAFLMICTGS